LAGIAPNLTGPIERRATMTDSATTVDTKGTRVVGLRVARHVLWHLGDYSRGVQPGDFEQRLMLAIDAADQSNRDVLFTVYPEHVIGLRDGRKHWGLDWLRGIASQIADPEADEVQL
jgi:hypothetical protein